MTRPQNLPTLFAVLTLFTGVLAGCGSQEDPQQPDAAKETACSYTETGQASRKVTPPPAEPKNKGEQKLDIQTNLGTLAMELDADKAPCAVNAVLSLVEQKFYDKTRCHRIAEAAGAGSQFHILQCGDPTGTGSGGPGYGYDAEVAENDTFPAGTIAMANAGQPGTTGSQFFICHGDTDLPPQYTVVGKLTPEGLATAKKMAKAGLKGKPKKYDGPPAGTLTLTKASVG